jgi:hypothetical protein
MKVLTSPLVAVVLSTGLWSAGVLALDAQELRQAHVEMGGASWSVKDPPLKRTGDRVLPPVKVMAGAIEESLPAPAFRPSSAQLRRAGLLNLGEATDAVPEALPEHYDWRNVNGVSYSTPVTAQGSCGSCVAFAATATIEMQLGIACNTPAAPFLMSRQYMFSCGGGNCKSGWLLSKAVEFVAESGVPDEPCLPYLSVSGEDVECSRACSDAAPRSVKAYGVERPTTGFIDVVAIKRALLRGPLLSSMILYEDLEFYESGVYRYTRGNKLGSHAVVITGWDDSDRSWIVRNSWGPDWGDGGYFKAAWDDSNVLVGRYTWLFDVASAVRSGVCNKPR